MLKFILICILLTLLMAPVFSQNYDLSGYVKYMFSSTKYPGLSGRLNDHLIHSRLNTRWYPSRSWRAAMDIRFRAFAGDSPEKIPFYDKLIQSTYDFEDLDAFIWKERSTLGYAEVDRLYLDYTFDSFQITAGRQRIAWGTTQVWNLIDLFNPVSILNFDYEEKPGADAVRLQYYTGPVSRLEFVYKPGQDPASTTAAGLWTANAFDYDFYLLGAVRNERWILGGAWDGYVQGGGFRGEWTISESPSEGSAGNTLFMQYGDNPYHTGDDAVFSATISGDYTFPNSFYIHTEALYNSSGVLRNAAQYQAQALSSGLLSPARWSLFQEFAYNLTPLIRTSVFTLWNPDDGSTITVPMIDWSVITNWDITLVAFITAGNRNTEFGEYGRAAFFRVKFSF